MNTLIKYNSPFLDPYMEDTLRQWQSLIPASGTTEKGVYADTCDDFLEKSEQFLSIKGQYFTCKIKDSGNVRTIGTQPPKQVKIQLSTAEGATLFIMPSWAQSGRKMYISNLGETCFESDSGTCTEDPLNNTIEKLVYLIFQFSENELFEDGMKSDFSSAISDLILNYHSTAVEIITDFLQSQKINSDLLCETLRTIGSLHDEASFQHRLQFIVAYLSHSSPFIRDCAGIALYDLSSPNAIPYIRKAIEREPYQSLKKDFSQIIAELENIKGA